MAIFINYLSVIYDEGNKKLTDKTTPYNRTIATEFKQKMKLQNRREKIIQLSPAIAFVSLVVFFSISTSGFFSLYNLETIMSQIAIPLVLSIGLTFVILTGSIDLSIDGTMGLTGTVVGFLVANNQNTLSLGIFGILVAVLIGGLLGLLIGNIYVKAKIPSFMVSYSMASIASGFSQSINNSLPARITDEGFRAIALEGFIGIPYITWIALTLFLLSYIIQEYTSFGRYIFAVGSNEKIPRMTGINVNRVKILVFAWSGLCIGLAGIIGAARLGQGTILIGRNNLFPTLTAVIVGGTSGGKGGVLNTFFGVLIVTVLNNGLVLFGVQAELQKGIQGFIILIALALSVIRNRKIISK